MQFICERAKAWRWRRRWRWRWQPPPFNNDPHGGRDGSRCKKRAPTPRGNTGTNNATQRCLEWKVPRQVAQRQVAQQHANCPAVPDLPCGSARIMQNCPAVMTSMCWPPVSQHNHNTWLTLVAGAGSTGSCPPVQVQAWFTQQAALTLSNGCVGLRPPPPAPRAAESLRTTSDSGGVDGRLQAGSWMGESNTFS